MLYCSTEYNACLLAGIQALAHKSPKEVAKTVIRAFKLSLLQECHHQHHQGSMFSTTSASANLSAASSAASVPDANPNQRASLGTEHRLYSKEDGVSACNIDMPLHQLAEELAGRHLHLEDGRDILRLITFRVTAAVTLGLPVDCLPRDAALDVVRKVGAYFKV